MFGCLTICSRKEIVCVLIARRFFCDSFRQLPCFSVFFFLLFEQFGSKLLQTTQWRISVCNTNIYIYTSQQNFAFSIYFSLFVACKFSASQKFQHQVFPIEKAVRVRDSNLIYALETQNLFTIFLVRFAYILLLLFCVCVWVFVSVSCALFQLWFRINMQYIKELANNLLYS